jgi:hypothetical protein
MTLLKDDKLPNKAKRLMTVVDAVLNEPGLPPNTLAVLVLVDKSGSRPEIHVTQNCDPDEAQAIMATVGSKAVEAIKREIAIREAVKKH